MTNTRVVINISALVISLLSLLTLCFVLLKPQYFVKIVRNERRQTWAVLVAGSRGWENYRHQADVCHAYQVLHDHGVPDDNIVVMMYDDIAENELNPDRGKIYNKPGGPDVYKGVPKDYTGEDVTLANFIAVLKGDRDLVKDIGSGKVLSSGPDDDVFIYFADHGAYGIVSFPSTFLDADTLHQTLSWMHSHQRYHELLFYLESCESGSMFRDYLSSSSDLSVLAVTAANSTEPSFACFYDEHLKTFIADIFSFSWMENSEMMNHDSESLLQQIQYVILQTSNYSHTSVYGSQDIESQTIGLFQGNIELSSDKNISEQSMIDVVPSYEVELRRLQLNLDDLGNQNLLNQLLENYKRIDEIFAEILLFYEETNNLEIEESFLLDRKCYFAAVRSFHQKCLNLGEHSYALRKVKILQSFCTVNRRVDTNFNDIFSTVC